MSITKEDIQAIYKPVAPFLNEKQRRILCGAISYAAGRGGAELTHEATGCARQTITRGREEVLKGVSPRPERTKAGGERIRRPGAGRPRLESLSLSQLAVTPEALGEMEEDADADEDAPPLIQESGRNA